MGQAFISLASVLGEEEKAASYKSRREASEDTSPSFPLIPEVQALEP